MSNEDADLEDRVIANLRALQQRNAARPDPPPLRIHHLLVCTIVAAIVLSLLRYFLALSGQQHPMAGVGLFGFTQVLTSIGLTLFGFSVYWWRKGYAAFSQPGQVLLAQYAASFMLYLLNILLMLAFLGVGRTGRPPTWISSFSLFMGLGSLLFGVLLPIAFYGWCAWKIADTWPWRAVFILCALAAVLTSTLGSILMRFVMDFSPANIQYIIGVPQLIRGTLLLGAGLWAVASDLSANRRRSWTHWAGVILWLLGQIGALGIGLYYMFFWTIV